MAFEVLMDTQLRTLPDMPAGYVRFDYEAASGDNGPGAQSTVNDANAMESTRTSLLFRIKDRQDEVAWKTFDTIYRPMLRRFAKTRGLDREDAEDVVQHCLAAILRHLESFDYDPAKGRFRGWLRTIVNNHVRNLLRKRHVACAADLDGPADPHESPEAVFDRIWMEEHLKHALHLVRSETDETTFAAFRLYVIDGWPVDRVCKTLQLFPEQVYRIKWRMTRKLREKMNTLSDDGLESS